jgi:hypothetical protein
MEQQVSTEATTKINGRKPGFQPGQSGNPAGRPKGSRNKLGEAFLNDLYADYQQHGAKAIADVRETNPAAYLKVIANLLPAQVQADVNVGVQVVMLPAPRSHEELEQLHAQRLLDLKPDPVK